MYLRLIYIAVVPPSAAQILKKIYWLSSGAGSSSPQEWDCYQKRIILLKRHFAVAWKGVGQSSTVLTHLESWGSVVLWAVSPGPVQGHRQPRGSEHRSCCTWLYSILASSPATHWIHSLTRQGSSSKGSFQRVTFSAPTSLNAPNVPGQTPKTLP